MLKNIYFTNFGSENEPFVNDLINLNNTPNGVRLSDIHVVDMKYHFKKFDFIEIDCKLMFNHSAYQYSNNTHLYYGLYDGILDEDKMLLKENRRYNQFSLMYRDRVIAYTKLCYRVEYNMDNITFIVKLSTANSQMNLIMSHNIIQYWANYITIKHYGKV